MRQLLSIATLCALAATLACAPAQGADSWAATKTFRGNFDSAVMTAPMQSGEAVHVVVTLQVRDKAGLDAFVAALMTGRTHRHLTPAEFLARHAPTDAQAQAVVDHLAGAGFTNVRIAKNRMLVSADGTAATARLAFDTELAHFDVAGRNAYANVSDARVPAHLGGIVNAVLGLQTIAVAHTNRVRLDAKADAKSGVIAHDPADFAKIYGATGLPPASKTTIAILAEGDMTPTLADLAAFTAKEGYPTVDTRVIDVNAPSADTSETAEFAMDSQSSLAAAGGRVKQMLFYVGGDFTDATLALMYNGPVADGIAQVINGSLGECETATLKSGLTAASDLSFEIGLAQGQLFAFSSGDAGSYQCGSKTGGESYPAVSPWVMAVGGTTLTTTGAAKWAGETVWSCSSAVTCNRLVKGGAGGGASTTETMPSWQAAAKVLTRAGRGMPDVSFDGDPASGVKVLIDGGYQTWGGTSLAAPLFSGFWTRIQSAHDNALTFPVPALYGLIATDGGIFHDVTSGRNGGYAAAAGWDYASGFGSVDIGRFSAFIDANPGSF